MRMTLAHSASIRRGAMHLSRMIACVLFTCASALAADPPQEADGALSDAAPRLIIRIDDIGFCHAANMATERILNEGVCTAVSVIVNTPWLDEAVEILQKHTNVSVGVHLALNSEWREYRWGPVLPVADVPSLVDAEGRFFPSRKSFFAHNPRPEEIRKELRAQIELALRKGLRISYVDYHMGTAMSTPECQRIVEELAGEFDLGISKYFGETVAPTVYRTPPKEKQTEAVKIVDSLTESLLYLFVAHPGLNTPEMAAMTDLNPTGVKPMAEHRQAITDLLCSQAFKDAIARNGIKLVTYDDLRNQGLDKMNRPWEADPYGEKRQIAEPKSNGIQNSNSE